MKQQSPNLLRQSLTKFILVSILIFIINILLIFTFVLYLSNTPTPSHILEQVSKQITITDKQVRLNQKGQDLLADKHIWALVIDQKTGKEVYQFQKPKSIASQFDYADVLQFSRYYLSDYPVFSSIHKGVILILGFPKHQIVRYSNNYMEMRNIRLIPVLVLGILLFNCLYFAFLYYYSVSHINRKILPLVNAIQNLPDGLKTPIHKISELQQLTTAINQTDKLLKENEQFKEKWISGIAHDIKTPLSVIMSNASLLQENLSSTQEKRQIATILTESYYIQNIINDLNILARLSTGNVQLEKTTENIISFFKEMIIQMINQENWVDFQFEFDYDPQLLGKTMMVESNLMKRVIHNLLYNAILHNKQGCTISTTLQLQDGNLTILIQDDGDGIDSAKLAELNKASFNNIDISKIRFNGIGLKISKQIIHLHHGQLIFDSQKGQYFEAHIQLPVV